MKIHFAISHPHNDRLSIAEIEDLIRNGSLFLVTCRGMDTDFWDAISLEEYDHEKDRKNRHYAEDAKKITSLSEIDPEYLTSIETYCIKDDYDESYWTVTIVTDENLEEFGGE